MKVLIIIYVFVFRLLMVENVIYRIESVSGKKVILEGSLSNITQAKEVYFALAQVIDNFSRNKKRQLHKALSLHAERGLDIETFYLFHSRCLGEKNKRISYTREFLLVLAKKCERNQCCETIAIRNADGELYAAGFVVWDTDAMHYLIAAQDEQHNDSGAMALLVLECIKLAREKGVKFDFEGSMIRGVARHFQQFGAKPAQYCCVYKYYSWWFAIVYWFYRLFTRDQR